MGINGILNLYKPSGRTSFDLVRQVKQLTRQKRVGHGGTLDPLASGVLPICIGQATRVTEFLAEATKIYQAEMVLGIATDTYDAEGEVVSRGDPSAITYRKMEEALSSFRGSIKQVPPMYSALKHEGKRLYELARAGITVEREQRETFIHRLEVAKWNPPLVTLDVECGRGAYIRSLAEDLGQALGCGAHLKALIRLKTGPFDVNESVSPDDFAAAVRDNRWEELVYPVDFPLLGMEAAIIDKSAERAATSGQPITVIYADYAKEGRVARLATPGGSSPQPPYRCRAYSLDGRFLAVLTAPTPSGPWAPKKVFSLTAQL